MLIHRNNRTSVDKLHDDVMRADVIDLADIGMVERCNRLRFAFKTLVNYSAYSRLYLRRP